jgi:hypothetical protein
VIVKGLSGPQEGVTFDQFVAGCCSLVLGTYFQLVQAVATRVGYCCGDREAAFLPEPSLPILRHHRGDMVGMALFPHAIKLPSGDAKRFPNFQSRLGSCGKAHGWSLDPALGAGQVA